MADMAFVICILVLYVTELQTSCVCDQRPLWNWKTSCSATLGETNGPFLFVSTETEVGTISKGSERMDSIALLSLNWAFGTPSESRTSL